MANKSSTSPQDVKDGKDMTKFEGTGVVFKAKLIGLELVPEARGDKMCQNSIMKLKAIIKGTNSHKRRITIAINFDGIKVYDEKTNEILHHHKVPEISYIAKDDQDSRTFGYVFGVPSKTHQFICFKTAGPAATIMSVISDLFDCVLQRKNQEKQQKQQLSSGTQLTKSVTGGSTSSEHSADNLSSLLFDIPAPTPTIPAPPVPLAQPQVSLSSSFWPTTGTGAATASATFELGPFEMAPFDAVPLGTTVTPQQTTPKTKRLTPLENLFEIDEFLGSNSSSERNKPSNNTTMMSSSLGLTMPSTSLTTTNTTSQSTHLPRQQSWAGEFDRYAAFNEIDVLSSVFESALTSANSSSNISNNNNSNMNNTNARNNINNHKKTDNNLFNFTKNHAELTRSSSQGGTSQNNIFARKNPFADEFFS